MSKVVLSVYKMYSIVAVTGTNGVYITNISMSGKLSKKPKKVNVEGRIIRF